MDLDLSATQFIAISLAVIAGAMVQGSIGFAFAIVVTPLAVWMGVPLPVTIAMVAVAIVVQTGMSVWQRRDALPWREVLTMFSSRALGLPVGIALLEWLVAGHEAHVKQVVGASVLLALGLVVLIRPKPRLQVWRGWTLVVGFASGAMAGLVGMGGPPIVLWLTAHDWSADRSRAFLWLSFLLMGPIQLSLMGWRFGEQAGSGMLLGALITPMVLLGTHAGMRIGRHFNRERLRVAMFSLLAIIGLISLISPALVRG